MQFAVDELRGAAGVVARRQPRAHRPGVADGIVKPKSRLGETGDGV